MAFLFLILSFYYMYGVSSKSPPNIVFILADDLGWADVGFHRNDTDNEVQTPNIDKIATKEGLQLHRHYVYFICAPTRSSFQSGRLPVHVNTNDVTPTHYQQGIPQNMTCLGTKMKEAGYSTHIVGKWDVGLATFTHTPSGRGYDSSLVYYNAEIEYYNHTNKGCKKYYNTSYVDLWLNDSPAYIYNNSMEYVELIFADHIYNLIDSFAKNKSQPFFMIYTPHIVHAPLQIPEEYYIFDFDNDENECKGKTDYIWPGFDNSTQFKCRTTYHAM
eukprot:116168_1